MDPIGFLNVFVSGLLIGMVYGLMALGLSVIFGVARVVNFAHGEMMTVAMYIAMVLLTAWGIDPFLSALPVAALFFVFGYYFQRKVVQPFVTRADHTQFILLLAAATIMTNALLMVFGPDARGARLDYLLESIEAGPLLLDRGKLYAALVAAGAAAGLFGFFRFTLTGAAIRASADDWLGAKVTGLNVEHLYGLSFGLGAASVAVAGCMMVLLVDLTPGLGPAFTLLAFVVVIVGGLGSLPGAIVAGLLVGISEAVAGLYISPSAKSMVSFALLIVVLLLRPQGLAGAKS